MKINFTGYRGRNGMSIVDAVIDATTPNAYSYSGQLEKLAQENEKLREIVARLIDTAFGEASYRFKNAEKIKYILGHEYEVEE